MKAILILDETPDCCYNCPCVDLEYENCQDNTQYRRIDYKNFYKKRPVWCHIIPISQSQEEKINEIIKGG